MKISTKDTEVLRLSSLYKAKAVYAASERQYTAAGGEGQIPWGGIHAWLKAEPQLESGRVFRVGLTTSIYFGLSSGSFFVHHEMFYESVWKK